MYTECDHAWVFLRQAILDVTDARGVYVPDGYGGRMQHTCDIFYCQKCIKYRKIEIGDHRTPQKRLERLQTEFLGAL
jgi:hypothetical protein